MPRSVRSHSSLLSAARMFTLDADARAAKDDHVDRSYPGDGAAQAVPGVQPGTAKEPRRVATDAARGEQLWIRRGADETVWQIGGSGEVAWITDNTRPGTTIATAIPPNFDGYATVIVPETPQEKRICDDALLSVLAAHSSPQPWWLGYLETGVADLVFPEAPRVQLYVGWPYVLVQAGPHEAGSWRSNDQATPWHSSLPELMFPLDHSWLVSTLWDDDWRCVGGPKALIRAILRHPQLESQAVELDQDPTPPGHHDG
jgi:hypothetical protein